ncbi:hypothetical protein [Bacillus safensis]|uniref:hypothetical protein n=1 Tax=Bacillus safensis TaxID=561879 RepID=UPI0021E57872|nr:hypothetical protein [Bacillus safensis]UXO88738.1 hypothetical protein N7921_03285 [Bacillus safensis]
MSVNNVTGTILLDVSKSVDSNKEELAILESYYSISEERVQLDELILVHKSGKKLGTVKVHNVSISWNNFFGGIKNESI